MLVGPGVKGFLDQFFGSLWWDDDDDDDDDGDGDGGDDDDGDDDDDDDDDAVVVVVVVDLILKRGACLFSTSLGVVAQGLRANSSRAALWNCECFP